MRYLAILLVIGVVAIASCGSDETTTTAESLGTLPSAVSTSAF